MARNNELTERDEQQLTNAMVADTEAEILAEALGDEELDNDGDDSLEQMQDPLEEDIDDEDVGDGRSDTDVDPDAEGEDEGDEEEEEGELETAGEDFGEGEPVEGEQQPEIRPQRSVPPGRLREEAERRRLAESEAAELRAQLATLNTTVGELRAFMQGRQTAPTAAQPQPGPAPGPAPAPAAAPAPPDKFADPDGYDRWFLEEIDRRAEAKARAQFDAFQTSQRQQQEALLNDNLARAATGPRGAEFEAAYEELSGIHPRTFQPIPGKHDAAMRDPTRREVVARMMNAADPAGELFAWWEENGGQEWRERQEAAELERLQERGYQIIPPQPRRGSRQQSQQPQHEVRLPASLRSRGIPPSLNETVGGQRQQITDPEMYDGSEESIAAFAFRR